MATSKRGAREAGLSKRGNRSFKEGAIGTGSLYLRARLSDHNYRRCVYPHHGDHLIF